MEKKTARICVPVCVARASELPQAVARATGVADIIELRLDCLSDLELTHTVPDLHSLITSRSRPIILTLRPAEYGGARAISVGDRIDARLRNSALTTEGKADFWDLELDLALLLRQTQGDGSNWDWSRTICSYHDFKGVPADFEQIYEGMAGTESRILKIAVQADDAIDCLPVFSLLDRARKEGREMIAIAMGEAGIMTRILGPPRGAFLTYGALDKASGTAEGQVTAGDLREVYRIDHINEQTEITGLVGQPVSHSISPHIQNAAFASAGINAVYLPFAVGDASAFIRRMVHPRSREIDWKLRGLSITAPHKRAVMQHLDWIEPAAKAIGAVNTIVIEQDELHGYNTDAEAFIQPLRNRFGAVSGVRCALIGTGGAARSAIWALQNEAASVSLFARDVNKARMLAEEFGIDCYPLKPAAFGGFDILVNATPVGTRGTEGNETLAVAEQLRGVRLVYDLVYNPVETSLMVEARAAGCDVLGGLEMLIAQAAQQFKLWTGRDPDTDIMRTAALKALAETA